MWEIDWIRELLFEALNLLLLIPFFFIDKAVNAKGSKTDIGYVRQMRYYLGGGLSGIRVNQLQSSTDSLSINLLSVHLFTFVKE